METIIMTILYDKIIADLNNFIPDPIADNEDDFTVQRECAYRKYKSLDDMESDNEKVRRYLTKHFRYLMTNVFYQDMKKYKAKGSKGSFFIFRKDAAIVKEILLRSVSQNTNDIIIGRWLEGKIKDNDYEGIVELCDRLFYVITQVEDADSTVKSEWIEALRLALRTDMAYTMIEVEYTLQNIFYSTLQFRTDECISSSDQINHSYIRKTMINQVNALEEKGQAYTDKNIYAYLESLNIDKLTSIEAFPPIELLRIKNVCEYFYSADPPDEDYPPELKECFEGLSKHGNYIKHFPNSNMIDKYTNYFLSVDKEYKKRLENRKMKDKERYEKKSKKSS